MRLALGTRSESTFDLDEPPRFKVVILYEDGPTGLRAKRFYDRLVYQLDDECDFKLALWNFQVLGIPEFANAPEETAVEADLLILSLHGKNELPEQIRDWIEAWTGQIIDRSPALVALVDKTKAGAAMAASTLTYLNNITERAGIAFFGHAVFAPDLEQ